MLERLWESNGFQLLFGMFGIYTCYWISGYFQEKTYRINHVDPNNPTKSPTSSIQNYS